jgi:two-component sensor histidine kinase
MLPRGSEYEEAFFDYAYCPVRDENGAVAGLIHTAVETTDSVIVQTALRDSEERFRKSLRDDADREPAEERQLLLIAELKHRVTNTLAQVQSIANQTLCGNPDPAQFAEKFQARLQALARAHALLTRRNWESADIADLIREQMIPVGDGERITLQGPTAFLTPTCAVALSLVLHELGMNARTYGALSVASGRLHVHWRVSDAESVVDIEWTESGGPAVWQPERRSFGTNLIETSLRGVNGWAALRFAPAGLLCHMQVPLAVLTNEITPSAKAD